MSTVTQIEWCNLTWGPVLGCSKVSQGCANCYAILTCWRLAHNPNPKISKHYQGLVKKLPDGKLAWTGQVNCIEERLEDPLHWKKPSRVFVNSQSDLFHKNVPDSFIDKVFAVMALCPQHTFIILTKRPQRMFQYMTEKLWTAEGKRRAEWACPLPNVQLGVSVEDQATANERIPLLLRTPAAVRVVSMEPLLGEVDLKQVKWDDGAGYFGDCLSAHHVPLGRADDHPTIDGVYVGGESGAGARPMFVEWVRLIRDDCEAVGVKFHFKQWGNHVPARRLGQNSKHLVLEVQGVDLPDNLPAPHRWPDGSLSVRVGKKIAGRLLDGKLHDDLP